MDKALKRKKSILAHLFMKIRKLRETDGERSQVACEFTFTLSESYPSKHINLHKNMRNLKELASLLQLDPLVKKVLDTLCEFSYVIECN